MAAKKRKKAKKPAKAKRPPAKSRKTAKKNAKPSRTRKIARENVKTAKVPAKKAVKSSRKTKGEGDYAASRRFLKDQSGFVERNKAAIPAMGKEAEVALDGPEGAALRDAEATAAARSRDSF